MKPVPEAVKESMEAVRAERTLAHSMGYRIVKGTAEARKDTRAIIRQIRERIQRANEARYESVSRYFYES